MIEITGTQRSIRSNIVFAFAVAFACYLAWLLRHELLLLYVAALFAVVLQPILRFTADLRIGRFQPFRRIAILVLLFVAFGGIAAFCFLAVPPVVRDLHEFASDMPQRLPGLIDKLKRLPFANHINFGDVTARVGDAATRSATFVLLSAKNWASALWDIAMGIILTIYFTLEGDVAYRWAMSFFPRPYRGRLDSALRRADVRMGKWLLGQGALMLILGVCSTVTFSLLQVRYAYALGFLTGLLNIVPLVGAAVCILLTMLIAAIDSWQRVLGVAIFYLIWANVENSILIPRIMKSSVGLPGLAILVSLLIGSALGGIMGAMVSVPTAVLVAVLIDEYLLHKEP